MPGKKRRVLYGKTCLITPAVDVCVCVWIKAHPRSSKSNKEEKMRRSLIISTVLAATVAVMGACETKTETPVKPVATPAPVSIATPLASPVASPVKPGDPTVKPGTTPEVKKPDEKNVNKDVKPVETPKAK